jgi:hypothetical protein
MTMAAAAFFSLASMSLIGQAGQGGQPAGPPGGGAAAGQRGGGGAGGGRGGGAPAPPAGPVKRMPDGKPDMTGYWAGGPAAANIMNSIQEIGGKPVDQASRRMPYTPEYAGKAKANLTNLFDEPELHCFLSGVPLQTSRQFGFQIISTPGYWLTINEFMGAVRHIPTDGRPHISPAIKLFNGDSVGRWEGDTLVIETTNSNDRTWLDNIGNVHSDELKVVERWTPVDANTIQVETTMTDPKAYTEPYKITGTMRRSQLNDPTYEQMEFACIEGNQDLQHYLEAQGGTAKPAPSAAPPGSEVPPGQRGGRGGGGGTPPEK